MPATLTRAFAYGAVRDRNYPMVGTMLVYVLGELVLVLRRRHDTPIHPVLGRLKRHVEAEGKVAYCKPVRG